MLESLFLLEYHLNIAYFGANLWINAHKQN
jgi:hypothetical protein